MKKDLRLNLAAHGLYTPREGGHDQGQARGVSTEVLVECRPRRVRHIEWFQDHLFGRFVAQDLEWNVPAIFVLCFLRRAVTDIRANQKGCQFARRCMVSNTIRA